MTTTNDRLAAVEATHGIWPDAPEQQVEVTVVLPLTDNDGVPLTNEVAQVKYEVLSITGGYSASEQEGAWEDDGIVYTDLSERIVTIANPEQASRLREAAPRWKALLRQQALFYQTRAVDVEFI